MLLIVVNVFSILSYSYQILVTPLSSRRDGGVSKRHGSSRQDDECDDDEVDDLSGAGKLQY